MFRKKRRIDTSAMDTLIGEGSVFEGCVKSEASLRIEGRMIGDIECGGDVTIGESGNAASNITARNVVVAGDVYGNVRAAGTVTLLASGRLHGNIDARSLIVTQGAVFQGFSIMEQEQSAGESRSAAAPEPAAAI